MNVQLFSLFFLFADIESLGNYCSNANKLLGYISSESMHSCSVLHCKLENDLDYFCHTFSGLLDLTKTARGHDNTVEIVNHLLRVHHIRGKMPPRQWVMEERFTRLMWEMMSGKQLLRTAKISEK